MDLAIGSGITRAHVQPSIGANSGMAIADGASRVRHHYSGRDGIDGGQQEIILGAVRLEVWNRHLLASAGSPARCAAARFRSPAHLSR